MTSNIIEFSLSAEHEYVCILYVLVTCEILVYSGTQRCKEHFNCNQRKMLKGHICFLRKYHMRIHTSRKERQLLLWLLFFKQDKPSFSRSWNHKIKREMLVWTFACSVMKQNYWTFSDIWETTNVTQGLAPHLDTKFITSKI